MNVTMMPVYLKRRMLVPDAPRTRRTNVICQKLYVYIEHFASISAFEFSLVNFIPPILQSDTELKIYALLLSLKLCKNDRQIKWIMFVHNFCLIFYFENDSIKLKKAIADYSSDASSLSWNASSNPAFRMRIILSLSSSVMRDMAFSSDSSILSLKTFFSTSVRPSR